MRITRAAMENVKEVLESLAGSTDNLVSAIDDWLDEDAPREDRAEFRETLENALEDFSTGLADVASAMKVAL